VHVAIEGKQRLETGLWDIECLCRSSCMGPGKHLVVQGREWNVQQSSSLEKSCSHTSPCNGVMGAFLANEALAHTLPCTTKCLHGLRNSCLRHFKHKSVSRHCLRHRNKQLLSQHYCVISQFQTRSNVSTTRRSSTVKIPVFKQWPCLDMLSNFYSC
jgi:hypothetical protein